MKLIPNRLGIILSATLFNLLFEYSARGIQEFLHRPFFVLALFGIYFTYFAMLEDLMVRFKLTNYQILLVAFFYGLFPEAFLTGNLFNPQHYWHIVFAGINIGTLVVVNVFAWGVVQTMVTLYLANRFYPRNWNHPKMGKLGWTIAISYQLLMIVLSIFNPRIPRGTPISYLTLGLLIATTVFLLVRSLKKSQPTTKSFEPSRLMDFFAFSSVTLFLLLGTFFTAGPKLVTSQPLNYRAVYIEILWVIFVGLVFFAYRYRKKADIVV